MLKNYLTVALRNLTKHRTYALLNLFGLAIGLTSCLLIFSYVKNELSFDRFHAKADHIVRVGHEVSLGSGTKPIASTSYRVALHLMADLPELQVTHFSRLYSEQVKVGDKLLREERIAFADSSFFRFFDFQTVAGDPITALSTPYQVVITKTMAHKYFGQDAPVGETIEIGVPYGDEIMPLVVGAVIEDMPDNAHFHMDFLISMPTGEQVYPESLFRYWGWDSHYTYALLPEGYSVEKLESELLAFGNKHIQGDWFIKFFAQELTDIHLYSNLNSEIEANSTIQNVYIFSIVALIILIIAGVNYVNLATARASKRSREVGVRKAVGAQRQQVIHQFFIESFLLALSASLLALGTAYLLLPVFSEISGRQIELFVLGHFGSLLTYFVLSLFVGGLAGAYPALFLASFKPIQILKERFSGTSKASLFVRKGLVAAQFAISVAMIVGSIVVFQQLNFMRDKKLGVETEHTVLFPAQTGNLLDQYDSFKTELLRNPQIISVTSADRRIGRDINHGTMITSRQNGQSNTARISFVYVDWDYLSDYGVTTKAGRTFSRDFAADTTVGALIFNETAIRVLGMKPQEAVGSNVELWEKSRPIVGVVEDFHFEALYNPIKPMLFYLAPGGLAWISVKVRGDDLNAAMTHISAVWHKFAPERILISQFLDEDLYKLYQAEERFLLIFTIFSALAILTACLGVFGLASFTAAQRTKEVGIRKVMGASVENIVWLLSKEFAKLVLFASLIAAPIAYWIMNNWLSDFAYRIDIQAGVFPVAALLVLVIAMLTVTYQSIKAALTNAADTLRYE